ncbi:MAG TPA: hypothetical protein DCY07_04210, partial [Rhodospirillaceae bacterium]|nr:hypothetical protein [Rhodospirillaceae bacterium]
SIMGRIRNLREGNRLASRQIASVSRQAPFTDLQKSRDALHDLRATPSSTSTYRTSDSYRQTSRAVYRDPEPAVPAGTHVENEYNELMLNTTIGGGAANATTRHTQAVRQRIVPNMADRTAKDVLDWAGQVGGANKAYDTETAGMPRRTLVTRAELQRAEKAAQTTNAAGYRGQPLSSLSRYPQAAPVLAPAPTLAPMVEPAPTPRPTLAPQKPSVSNMFRDTAPPVVISEPKSYNAAPPVIYGAQDLPANPSTALPPVPMPNASKRVAPMPIAEDSDDGEDDGDDSWGFGNLFGSSEPSGKQASPPAYQKIDQDENLTTPQANTSRSSTKSRFRQSTNFAMVTDDTEECPPDQAKQPLLSQLPPIASSPTTTYGSRAVPLQGALINADRRWGFFVSGTSGFGHGEYQNTSSKAKTVRAGVTAGVDYRVQDKSFVGLALNYVHSSFSTNSVGELDGNSVSVSLYGTTDYATNAYVDGYISVGYHTLDSERTVLAGAGTTRKANADPDGFQFGAKAETGYDFKKDELKYGPYAGFRLAYADFGSFTESGAGNFNLKVKSTDDLSAISTLGFGGSMPFEMANGGVFLPALRVGYNHEFGDDQSNIKAEFANLAGSAFTTKGAKKSRDWINITPSLTAALANDWTFQLQYEHDFFRDNSNENIFNVAAVYKW